MENMVSSVQWARAPSIRIILDLHALSMVMLKYQRYAFLSFSVYLSVFLSFSLPIFIHSLVVIFSNYFNFIYYLSYHY